MRPAAPGSLTGENARMLEIERHNTESAADGQAGSDASLTGPSASPGTPSESADSGSQGNSGSHAKGLLRRRRAVTRPAGPPAAEPPAPAVAPPSANAPG